MELYNMSIWSNLFNSKIVGIYEKQQCLRVDHIKL